MEMQRVLFFLFIPWNLIEVDALSWLVVLPLEWPFALDEPLSGDAMRCDAMRDERKEQ